ncbi:hypothetical protein ACHAWF_004266, partial [Thalassiosira exigua]
TGCTNAAPEFLCLYKPEVSKTVAHSLRCSLCSVRGIANSAKKLARSNAEQRCQVQKLTGKASFPPLHFPSDPIVPLQHISFLCLLSSSFSPSIASSAPRRADSLPSSLQSYGVLHVKEVPSLGGRVERRRLDLPPLRRSVSPRPPVPVAVPASPVVHLVLHLPYEVQPSPRGTEHDLQPGTVQRTEMSLRPPGAPRPRPERRARDARQYRHAVGGVREQPAVGEQPRAHDPARRREAVDADDLVVGDVELDVPDPEAQPAVGGDVDAADGIVPEPGDGDEVADGDGDDGAVGADGDGHDEGGDEEGLEDEEPELERWSEDGAGVAVSTNECGRRRRDRQLQSTTNDGEPSRTHRRRRETT